MKLGLTMIAVVLGVAAAATSAHACGSHGLKPTATSADGPTPSSQTTTTATTTGKTTGG
ncbi:MAG TPA: hypothetical protein VF920_16050 [Dongiaceae bacterium]